MSTPWTRVLMDVFTVILSSLWGHWATMGTRTEHEIALQISNSYEFKFLTIWPIEKHFYDQYSHLQIMQDIGWVSYFQQHNKDRSWVKGWLTLQWICTVKMSFYWTWTLLKSYSHQTFHSGFSHSR